MKQTIAARIERLKRRQGHRSKVFGIHEPDKGDFISVYDPPSGKTLCMSEDEFRTRYGENSVIFRIVHQAGADE